MGALREEAGASQARRSKHDGARDLSDEELLNRAPQLRFASLRSHIDEGQRPPSRCTVVAWRESVDAHPVLGRLLELSGYPLHKPSMTDREGRCVGFFRLDVA